MSKALFVVSLDIAHAPVTETVSKLQKILAIHDKVLLFLADQMQVYNLAATVRDGKKLDDILTEFDGKSSVSRRLVSWAQKVAYEMSLGISGAKVDASRIQILTVNDISDGQFAKIFRRVITAYHTLSAFQQDVHDAATHHVTHKMDRYPNAVGSFGSGGIEDYPKERYDLEVSLSKAYILEAVALNMRLRLILDLESEYSVKGYLKPLVRLYSGGYAVKVHSLAGVPDVGKAFKFFEWYRHIQEEWRPMVATQR